MPPISQYVYDSWEAFKSQLIPELFPDARFRTGRYIFRGHRSADWQLTPTYDRLGFPHHKFQDLLQTFRRECEPVALDERMLQNENYFVAFAQHHGLPTRLLDWSFSPYIAAFFAYADLIQQEEVNHHVSVWILDTQFPIWGRELGVQILTVPSFGNIRIRNQAGCFTLSNTPFPSLEEYANHTAGNSPGWALRQCNIPANQYLTALPDLDCMGINSSHIFPGIEGSTAAAFLRWRCALLQNQ